MTLFSLSHFLKKKILKEPVAEAEAEKCMTGNWHFKRAISFLLFHKCAFLFLQKQGKEAGVSLWEKSVIFNMNLWVVVVVVVFGRGKKLQIRQKAMI